MKFPCTISRAANGQWTIRHQGGDVGVVEVSADTREAALEKMKGEIQYRLELCPCSGESYQHIAVVIVEQRAS